MFAARSVLALCVVAAVIALPAEAKKAAHKASPPPKKAAAAAPASNEPPTLLGVSRSWTAYTAGAGESKVCYAMASPKDSQPKGGARDPMYVIISAWPGRSVRDEVQVVPGYLYKEGEPVYAQVGNKKVEFFSRNDAKSGSAWVKDLDQEEAFVRSLRGGNTLTVTGVSKKGVKTTDTYALAGLGTALERAHQACGK